MFYSVALFFFVLLAFRLWNLMESSDDKGTKTSSNGSESALMHLWHHLIDHYGIPFGQFCISFIYSVYMWFTLFNVIMFILKYIPTGLYMYKFLMNMYVTSRERIKDKQIELEDIQLQIQIVDTKLCIRDAELTERAQQLLRDIDRLRKVRARIHNIIATDEALRRALDESAALDIDNVSLHTTPEQDREFIVELLKALKYENISEPERPYDKMECGECPTTDQTNPENSVYSSLNDTDMKQDCSVKIVKVTNVYKVAYLKHFIKQKRLRRAHKHALLKKKMESIKNLLEGWQKSLNMVLNNKFTILNMESRIDAASHEAMGDYSKPTLREYSDSDSDLRNSCDETTKDEYGHSWAQNYRCCYNFEDVQETGLNQEFCEPQEYNNLNFPVEMIHACECHDPRMVHKLSVLPEETTSQMAIEKINGDADDYQTHATAVV